MPSASSANPLAIVSVASPPPVPSVAAITSFVESTMDQWMQLLATVQQDISNALNTLGQEIAQEVSAVQQQWDQLLGINPTTPNPSLNTAVAQPSNDSGAGRGNASGSGSGSGATTTAHNGPNQALNIGTQQSGSGSGSGSSTTTHQIPSGPGSIKAQPLTSPGSGSGSCGNGITVQFEGNSSPVYESSCPPSSITIGVGLNQPSKYSVSVKYSTSDGTATAGTDYTAESGTLTFAPGVTAMTITIPILDDGTDETAPPGSEYFDVNLSSPMCASLGAPSQFVVYIDEGPQQAATDTLEWNPCMGNDASTVQNWYDVTQGFQLQKGALGPNPSSPIQFDGTAGSTTSKNAPINWFGGDVASIFLKNGYNATMTIEGDSTLTDEGALDVDVASILDVDFVSNSTFQVKGGGSIMSMNLYGGVGGLFDLAGGTMFIALQAGQMENLGVNLTIEGGAKLKDNNQEDLSFTDSNLAITVLGEMDTFAGNNAQNTMIGVVAGNEGDSINVNGGLLVYFGRQNINDTIAAPITVQGGGKLQVTVNTGSTQGSLIVQGSITNANNASVYLTGSSSSITLDNGSVLKCDNGYYQDSGTLKTLDATPCWLKAGDASDKPATVAGGRVWINQGATGYGTLNVAAVTLNLNGQLVVAIDANNQANEDVLKVSGATNLQANSTLEVFVNNAPPVNQDWKWLVLDDTTGIAINPGNFVMPMTTVPNTPALGDGVDPKNASDYIVKT